MPDENVQMYAGGAQRKNPDVIYYRNRKGWITWGDTQASKQLDMIRKGCVPLSKYGSIKHSADLWGPILRHPDGPAEFPVDQILAYHWYKKERLPDCRRIETVSSGKVSEDVRVGEQPRIVFPQLKGVQVTEFPCPEGCSVSLPGGKVIDRVFHNPIQLGTHLKWQHDYDRSEILKYGDAMGIDFSKVPGGRQVVSYDFGEAEIAMQEVARDEDDVVELITVSAASPATQEIKQEIETVGGISRNDCLDCGWVNKKGTAQGLDIHQKRWCKKVAVPA